MIACRVPSEASSDLGKLTAVGGIDLSCREGGIFDDQASDSSLEFVFQRRKQFVRNA